MNQAIQFNGVLTRVGTRSDGSLGITVETPALVPEDKLAVFNLQNIACKVTFEPNDRDGLPPKEIKGELSKRTISERYRAVVFCWWKSLGEPGSFDQFYQSEGEKTINAIKSKLPPQ
jgi:hypothetical protein